jgi:CRISPR-associated protein Cmr3
VSPSLSTAFFVRPVEPLYFGTPRSFAAGEAHHGRSLFPPPPSTFQGLVRSHLLRAVEPPHDLNDTSEAARALREQLVGGPEALPPGWQIQGPFPASRRRAAGQNEDQEFQLAPWVPTPRFLLRAGASRVAPRHARVVAPALSLGRSTGFQRAASDLGTGDLWLLGRPEENATEPLEGWVGPANLRWALARRGEWSWKEYGSYIPPFVHPESRPGLAIDPNTGTPEHGMLYVLETLRFQQRAGVEGSTSGLVGWFRGELDARIPEDALGHGTAAAGRKGRLAAVEPAGAFDPDWEAVKHGDHLPPHVSEEDLFWLLALTPARLAEPLRPAVRLPLSGAASVVIRGALIGPPLTLGGYELASHRSRPNRSYVPAGSAWLLQLRGGDRSSRAEALRRLHDAHPLGPSAEAGFGFGHTFVGLGPEPLEDES